MPELIWATLEINEAGNPGGTWLKKGSTVYTEILTRHWHLLHPWELLRTSRDCGSQEHDDDDKDNHNSWELWTLCRLFKEEPHGHKAHQEQSSNVSQYEVGISRIKMDKVHEGRFVSMPNSSGKTPLEPYGIWGRHWTSFTHGMAAAFHVGLVCFCRLGPPTIHQKWTWKITRSPGLAGQSSLGRPFFICWQVVSSSQYL